MPHPLLIPSVEEILAMQSEDERFDPFIADVVRQYLHSLGVPHGDMHLRNPKDVKDGSIDALVVNSTFNDPEGFFAGPLILQIKARDYEPAEIRSDFAPKDKNGKSLPDNAMMSRIRDEQYNVAYILCANPTSDAWKRREEALKEEAEKLNPAVHTKVLTAEDLCTIVKKFPGIALALKGVTGPFTPLMRQLALESTQFTSFVPGPEFEDVMKQLSADSNSVRHFIGRAGSGKTRTVIEAAASVAEIASNCVYTTSSEAAANFLTQLENVSATTLLVDEYVPGLNSALDGILRRGTGDIRVVCIHSGSENSGSGGLEIARPDESRFASILSKQFPDLNKDELSLLFSRTKGFLRHAYWLAEHKRGAQLITPDALAEIQAAEWARIAQREIIMALSLLTRLEHERSKDFCEIMGLDHSRFDRDCREAHHSHGFIMHSDFVSYVTPETIRDIATTRWLEERGHDKTLERLEKAFPAEFRTRVEDLPEGPSRESLRKFFFRSSGPLTISALTTDSGREWLHRLKMDPAQTLPLFRSLFEQSTPDDLMSYGYEKTDPDRRDLMNILHSLAGFPDYFEDAETILYLLSRYEVHSVYSNRAINTWSSLFGAWFHFTSTPFIDRFQRILNLAEFGDARDLELVLSALSSPFPFTSGMVPSRSIGGRQRIDPHRIEVDEVEAARSLIPKAICLTLERADDSLLVGIGSFAFDLIRTWKNAGQLTDLLPVLTHKRMPDEAIGRIAGHLITILDIERERGRDRRDYEEVLNTLKSRAPLYTGIYEVFSERLRSAEKRVEETEPNKSAKRLAIQYVQSAVAREAIDAIVFGPDWVNYGMFSAALGDVASEDIFTHLLDLSFEQSKPDFFMFTLRRYLSNRRDQVRYWYETFLSKKFDNPEVAITLVLGIVGANEAVDLAIELYKGEYVKAFAFNRFEVWPDKLTVGRRNAMVSALAARMKTGDEHAALQLLSVFHNWLQLERRRSKSGYFVRQYVPSAFKCLSVTGALDQTRDYEWSDLARHLAKINPKRVIRIALLERMLSTHPMAEDIAEVLKEPAKEEPLFYFQCIIRLLKNKAYFGRYFFGHLTPLFEVGDPDAFEQVLAANPKIARIVASHLPRPIISQNKVEFTEIVKRFFEIIPEGHPEHTRSFDNYFNSTRSLGIIGGYGEGLYEQMGELGAKAGISLNPILHKWGERFKEWANASLREAKREHELDDAPGGRRGSN